MIFHFWKYLSSVFTFIEQWISPLRFLSILQFTQRESSFQIFCECKKYNFFFTVYLLIFFPVNNIFTGNGIFYFFPNMLVQTFSFNFTNTDFCSKCIISGHDLMWFAFIVHFFTLKAKVTNSSKKLYVSIVGAAMAQLVEQVVPRGFWPQQVNIEGQHGERWIALDAAPSRYKCMWLVF